MALHRASLVLDGEPYYFVSKDGEDWYEVNRLPDSEEQVAHLYPWAAAGKLLPMSFATRFLRIEGSREGAYLAFDEVA